MKNLKQLAPGPLIGIILGAVLVVGLAGWFLLVRPQGAKVKSLKRDAADIQAKIKANDWNDYVVIAAGNHLQHFINGVQTVDVLDERTGIGGQFKALWPSSRHLSPKVRVFVDHLGKQLSGAHGSV